ncbi:MAG: hypothetical protein ACQEQ0_08225 [Bacteroidota bacterium]
MKKWYTYWRFSKSKKTVGISLLLAHWLIIVSYALFLHTHVLNDGTRVVHAHPFTQEQPQGHATHQNDDGSPEKEDQNNDPGHEHTPFSYLILTGLSNYFEENNTKFTVLTTPGQFLQSEVPFCISEEFFFNNPQRGPPFLFTRPV